MHEFFGLGTTHFTEIDEETGAKEILKLRVHSIMIKKVDGRPSVFWKEFMRDKIWLPEDGIGWPVFKAHVDFNLSSLSAMPTRQINGLAEVEKRVQVTSNLQTSFQKT